MILTKPQLAKPLWFVYVSKAASESTLKILPSTLIISSAYFAHLMLILGLLIKLIKQFGFKLQKIFIVIILT